MYDMHLRGQCTPGKNPDKTLSNVWFEVVIFQVGIIYMSKVLR